MLPELGPLPIPCHPASSGSVQVPDPVFLDRFDPDRRQADAAAIFKEYPGAFVGICDRRPSVSAQAFISDIVDLPYPVRFLEPGDHAALRKSSVSGMRAQSTIQTLLGDVQLGIILVSGTVPYIIFFMVTDDRRT